MPEIAKLWATIGADTKDFRQGLSDMDRDMERAKGSIGGMGKAFDALKMVGVGAIVGLGAAAVGLGTAMFKAGQEVDEAYDLIQIQTGATGKELGELKEAFGIAFADFPNSAAEVANTISMLSTRLKMTGEDLDIVTGSILDMSRLTKTDATANVQEFTRVMGDWGVQNQDGADTLDKLFKASQESGIGINDLMQKVVQFGAPMRLMGFNLNDAIALFAKWQKEGVNSELVMGSLRIAAGKFAKSQGDSTEKVKGGVRSMADAEKKLVGLKEQLRLAQLQQAGFTKKTSEYTREANKSRIAKLTGEINDLTAAMAKGEDRTVTITGSNKTLRESLLETFNQIKNNKDGTEALAIGMEAFGARAGPDMVAAIREGRFELDDMMKALDASRNSIVDAASATEDFPEKLTKLKNSITLALAPAGLAMMEFAGRVIDEWAPTVKLGVNAVGGYIADVFKLKDIGAISKKLSDDLQGVLSAAWPGIQAEVNTWPARFWGWLTDPGSGLIAQATTQLGGLTDAIRNWSTSSETKKAMESIGEGIGAAIVGGIKLLFGKKETGEEVWSNFGENLVRTTGTLTTAIVRSATSIVTGLIKSIAKELGKPEWGEELAKAIRNIVETSFLMVLSRLMAGEQPIGGTRLPGYATGGVVPGPLGAPQLAVVHGGETIIPAGQTTNNWNLTINSRAPTEPIIADFAMMRSLAGA